MYFTEAQTDLLEATALDVPFLRFLNDAAWSKDTKPLRDAGIISECEAEFGPHDNHDDCERTLDAMSGDDGYDDTDYSGWYGGEAGMENGLRWSDFI